MRETWIWSNGGNTNVAYLADRIGLTLAIIDYELGCLGDEGFLGDGCFEITWFFGNLGWIISLLTSRTTVPWSSDAKVLYKLWITLHVYHEWKDKYE